MAVILVGGLHFNGERLARERDSARKETAKAEAALKLESEAKHALEVGYARAESAKERVREIVRTVTLPPTSAACADDPAVRASYDAVRLVRDRGAGSPSGAAPPPGGVAGTVPARSPER